MCFCRLAVLHPDAVAERDRLQARVDELQAQLKAVNKKNDANDELANTADRQMSAIERMLMEQQRRRSAGLVTRVKWWLVGDPQMQAELDDELGEWRRLADPVTTTPRTDHLPLTQTRIIT